MWEDLTAALCIIGFTGVVAVLLVDLPAVLNPALTVRVPEALTRVVTGVYWGTAAR
jgi:hypothetical protein